MINPSTVHYMRIILNELSSDNFQENLRRIHLSTTLLHLEFDDVFLIFMATLNIHNKIRMTKNHEKMLKISDRQTVVDEKYPNFETTLNHLEKLLLHSPTDQNNNQELIHEENASINKEAFTVLQFISNILFDTFMIKNRMSPDATFTSNKEQSPVNTSVEASPTLSSNFPGYCASLLSSPTNEESRRRGRGKVVPILNNSPIPAELLEKIVKKKKSKRYYKDMDQKQKDIDNQFDYCLQSSYYDHERKPYDNGLNGNIKNVGYIIDYYSDIDIEFRRIMLKIVNFNKQHAKDKDYASELQFLEEYFEKTLGLKRVELASRGRLNNSIANLMKQIQKRMFAVNYSYIKDDHNMNIKSEGEEFNILHFIKNRLYIFYNHYRK